MPEKKWILVNAPVAGLRLDMPSALLPPQNTPACSNMRFINAYMEKGKGAGAFAGTGTVALDGKVMKLVQFGNDTGTQFLICLTSTKTYELYGGTFTDRSSAAWTGDEDDRFCAIPYNNQLIICNGKEAIREWDTTNADDAALSGADDFRPNWMGIFGERLCLYGVYNNNASTNYPRRIRWCVAGDATDWSGSGSGAKDLRTDLTDGDEIQRAEPLGGSMIVYGKTSTAVQDYRSNVASPFPVSKVSSEFGLAAPDALSNIAGGEHIILSLDNINSFKGGRSATPIDAAIHDDLFQNINRQYMNRSFMIFAPEHDKIRLFYPRGSDTTPGHFFELNLRGMTWSRGTRSYVGAGRYRNATNKLFTMYGDGSGVVYEDDETDLNAGSTAISGSFETPDFLGEEQDETITNNWDTLYVKAKGGAGDKLTVEFSIDSGSSWVAAPPRNIELSTDWTLHHLTFEVENPKLRLRFSNALLSESFAVEMYKVGYIPASEMGTV